MTITSLEELQKFIDLCDFGPGKEKWRIADYGGNEGIGSDYVKKILSDKGITDYNILDLSTGVDLREPVPGDKYHLGLCMDLLEHTSNPFLVAKNIQDSLVSGAFLYVTVPFIWPIHGDVGKYQDYWRFTPDGLEELFKDMEMIALYGNRDSYEPDEVPPPETFAPPTPYVRIIGIFKKK